MNKFKVIFQTKEVNEEMFASCVALGETSENTKPKEKYIRLNQIRLERTGRRHKKEVTTIVV